MSTNAKMGFQVDDDGATRATASFDCLWLLQPPARSPRIRPLSSFSNITMPAADWTFIGPLDFLTPTKWSRGVLADGRHGASEVVGRHSCVNVARDWEKRQNVFFSLFPEGHALTSHPANGRFKTRASGPCTNYFVCARLLAERSLGGMISCGIVFSD